MDSGQQILNRVTVEMDGILNNAINNDKRKNV
jgi:hypothetical protein